LNHATAGLDVVDAGPLPRNPQSKLLKRELRQSLLQQIDKPA
jgi:hypothetical protein